MTFGEETIYRCPKRVFLDDPVYIGEVVTSYRWKEAGFLPEPGTWQDQPAKLITLYRIADLAVSDASKYQDEAAKRKSNTR